MDAMEIIRQKLREGDWSTGALSRATGIQQPNISQFKAGTRDIRDIRLLGKLAKEMGLEIVARRKRGSK